MRLSRAESRAVAHNDVGAFEEAVRAAGGTAAFGSSSKASTAWTATSRRSKPWPGWRASWRVSADRRGPCDRRPGPAGVGWRMGWGRDNVLTLHTCGKALGLSGALVCLPRVLREFLINRCRNFIFATAPSPLLAATIRAALGVIERADDRRAALAERVRRVGEALRRLAVAQPSGTHIQPVIVGSDKARWPSRSGCRRMATTFARYARRRCRRARRGCEFR